MAKQFFQFGDRETSDIKLQLIAEDGDYVVYLHSNVLKKSEFYEAWLCLDEELRGIKMITSVSKETYLKCFELMYWCEADEAFCFSGVDEALDILTVASQMQFNEGIHQCMDYLEAVSWSPEQEVKVRLIHRCMKHLEAVSWSPEQEVKVRLMLSSLQINNILPELAARIGMNLENLDCRVLDMVKQTLQQILSAISSGSSNSLPRTEVEKHIIGYFEAANKSSNKALPDACRSALLQEFRANVERIRLNEFSNMEEPALRAWSTLLWLFDVIRRCDDKLYQTFVEIFCEIPASIRYGGDGVNDKVDILLDQILNAMGNGEIMTPASFRVSFLTNWLYAMVLLVRNHPMKDEKLSALETGIMNVADTLPLPLQKSIYNLWKDAYERLSMDYSNALKWWAQKVQDAIKNGKIISYDYLASLNLVVSSFGFFSSYVIGFLSPV